MSAVAAQQAVLLSAAPLPWLSSGQQPLPHCHLPSLPHRPSIPAVGPSAASEARLLRSHLPPSKLESPAPRRHLHAGPRPLSCMRLPMVRCLHTVLRNCCCWYSKRLFENCIHCGPQRVGHAASHGRRAIHMSYSHHVLPGTHTHPVQIRPDSYRFILWSSLVLLSDLTYSAFIVPIRCVCACKRLPGFGAHRAHWLLARCLGATLVLQRQLRRLLARPHITALPASNSH